MTSIRSIGSKPRVGLVNFTAEYHWGSRMVCEAFMSLLYHCDVVCFLKSKNWTLHTDLLKTCDIILVNGEGSIHHGHGLTMLDIPHLTEVPTWLCNASIQETPLKRMADFQGIWLRETESLAIVDMPHAAVMGDISLVHPLMRPSLWQVPIERECLKTDSVVRKDWGEPPTHDVMETLRRYASSEYVITGRFHGLCTCIALQIPVVGYGSNTHKNHALCADFGIPFAISPEAAEDLEPAVPNSMLLTKYRADIREFFRSL